MINKTLSKFSIFYCSLSELLLQKIKILLLLAVFTASSFNVFAQNSSLISNCSDFVAGSNSAWPYVQSLQLLLTDQLVKELKHLP